MAAREPLAARALGVLLPRRLRVVPRDEIGWTLGALLGAVAVGVALAVDVRLGVALLTGLLYVPLVLVSPRLGVALFVPLVFLEGLPAFNAGAKLSGVLLVGAWLGTLGAHRARIALVLGRHRRLVGLAGALLVWLTLSTVWAASTGAVLADIWHWYAVALLVVIVATTVPDESGLRLVAVMFVVGAVLSVVIGFAQGNLTHAGSAVQSASATGARLEGATGDPNFLAAGAIAGLVIAGGLFAAVRRPAGRWALGVAIVVLVAGLVASQSRGGVVAALTTLAAAFFFFKGRRVYVTAFALLMVGVAVAAFSVSPGAWERVRNYDNGGSGRSDLWTVAWRMTEDHPLAGVGLNNFTTLSRDYAREPGTLERVALITENPHLVHNTYLQLWAEAGLIGLGLFTALVLGCLASMWRAAERFASLGRPDLETLARAVLVGSLGMLAALFFVSGGVDKRLWILFGMGLALEALAAAQARTTGAPQ